jgi:hypothetical protein
MNMIDIITDILDNEKVGDMRLDGKYVQLSPYILIKFIGKVDKHNEIRTCWYELYDDKAITDTRDCIYEVRSALLHDHANNLTGAKSYEVSESVAHLLLL